MRKRLGDNIDVSFFKYPETTIQAGSNLPHGQDLQTEFLVKRFATDIYVVLEGEIVFLSIVELVLPVRDSSGGVLAAGYNRPGQHVFRHPLQKY